MTNNIVSINRNGEVVPPPEPSAKLIEFLEKQVERAKAGEIRGMAGAMLERDNTGSYFLVGFTGGFSMVGALDVAHVLLVRNAMGEA